MSNKYSEEYQKRLQQLRDEAEARYTLTPLEGLELLIAEDLLHDLQVNQIELEIQNEAFRQVHQALEESRDRYRDLYEFAPIGYLSISSLGLVTELNWRATAMLGLERKHIIDHRFDQFVADEDKGRWQRQFSEMKAFAGGEELSFDLKFALANGLNFHANLNCVRMDDDEDQPMLRITLEDITQIKVSEDALIRREGYQRALLDNFPFFVWLKDEKSKFLAANHPFAKVCGLVSPEQLLGKSDFDFFARDLAESYRADDRAVLKSGKSSSFEEIIEVNGKRVRFETYKSPVMINGDVVGTVGFARDITAQIESISAIAESRNLLMTIINTAPVRVFWKDCDSRYLGCNLALANDAGLTSTNDVIGKDDYQMVWADKAEHYRADDLAVMESGMPKLFYEQSQILPNGQVMWTRASKVPLKNNNNEIIGLLGVYEDITEQKRSESFEQFRSRILELLTGEESIHKLLESIVLGVEQLNPQAICSVLLLDNERKRLVNAVAPSLPDFYNSAIDGIEIGIGAGSCGTAAFTGERVIVEDITKHSYWAPYRSLAASAGLGACWSQPICSSSGQVLGTFAIYHRQSHSPTVSDISIIEQSARLASIAIERKVAAEEIEHLAFYDTLTLLPNRRLLLDRLNHALAASGRSGKQGALLFLDLDHFKTLNDTRGHDVGDLLLQQVAERLTSCVREGDTVARLGGDEFVVVLEDLSEQDLDAATQAEFIAVKILAALNQPYLLAKHKHHSSTSIGVTLFNGHQSETEELLKQADIAMYQAKKAGRGTLRFFNPQMQETINARVLLERELRTALDTNQFQLYYQIQVDHLGQPLGAEALIRWLHPERGIVPPLQFIPLTEETGLILPIGQWVLETACAQLKTWQQDVLTRDLTLSINVSAKQFYQPDFVALVQTTVQRHAIDPMQLKLEMTESILLENIEDTIVSMTALQAIGVQFSLDDFGTGYSSLQYLKLLPLYQLKIDQSFVREIATDSSDRSIVRTIIAMAQSLYLGVIAEGVETEEQRELLLNNGCKRYQGYLFGKPMPIEEFNAALKSKG